MVFWSSLSDYSTTLIRVTTTVVM